MLPIDENSSNFKQYRFQLKIDVIYYSLMNYYEIVLIENLMLLYPCYYFYFCCCCFLLKGLLFVDVVLLSFGFLSLSISYFFALDFSTLLHDTQHIPYTYSSELNLLCTTIVLIMVYVLSLGLMMLYKTQLLLFPTIIFCLILLLLFTFSIDVSIRLTYFVHRSIQLFHSVSSRCPSGCCPATPLWNLSLLFFHYSELQAWKAYVSTSEPS